MVASSPSVTRCRGGRAHAGQREHARLTSPPHLLLPPTPPIQSSLFQVSAERREERELERLVRISPSQGSRKDVAIKKKKKKEEENKKKQRCAFVRLDFCQFLINATKKRRQGKKKKKKREEVLVKESEGGGITKTQHVSGRIPLVSGRSWSEG